MYFPKISIVTPSFNQANFLEKTILSILNQGYPNLEYIIIDGGSTDGSVEIIKKYSSKLTYWESQKDNGQYDAIQKGFEKSTGSILAWLNSDDIYHQKSLFTVADIFTKFKNVKWLTGSISIIDEDDRIVRAYKSRTWSKFNFYNNDFKWIQQESTFWTRDLWNMAGETINLEYNFAGDFELWMRFFRYEKLYTTDALIGAFRYRRENQKTLESYNLYLMEAETIISKEKLNNTDKQDLFYLKIWENFLSRIPGINRINYLKHRYNKIFSYPPNIIFDRDCYTFL